MGVFAVRLVYSFECAVIYIVRRFGFSVLLNMLVNQLVRCF